ncbi:hypothetical protein ABZ341_18045 [Streptomyces sp. NPDC006173]|uniref:hypothetical protein n=1 Tax=Streptomyces sp. NPDC006173 TaxID=3155349 RepID=UPI003405AE01
MPDKTTIAAIDGKDALAFVIIRPGKTPGGVSIEAAAKGLDKESAAYVLRNVAHQWDAGGDDSTATLAAFNLLAERYERAAAKATTVAGKQRAQQMSQAAADMRQVLTTGQIPARLMTEAEIAALTDQPAAAEESAS